jgi:uncharacterized protein (TIGR03086 family)
MDPIERIEKGTALAAEAVHNVKPDQLSDPTPCSDFDVRALLNHLLGGLEMLTTAAGGGKAEMPSGDLVGDGSDLGARYDERRKNLIAAVKKPGALDGTWKMPFGDLPAQMMASIAFMEHVTHAWDVRKATGQDTTLPADVVKETMDVVTPMDQMLRMPGVCGPAVSVPDTASDTDKLVAFLGRQP